MADRAREIAHRFAKCADEMNFVPHSAECNALTEALTAYGTAQREAALSDRHILQLLRSVFAESGYRPHRSPHGHPGRGESGGRSKPPRAQAQTDTRAEGDGEMTEGTHIRSELAEEHLGWLYDNEDAGPEYSENHPIESGEVPDAKNVRPATLKALRDDLLNAWKAWAEDSAAAAHDTERAYKRGHNDGYAEANKEWRYAPRDTSGIY